MTNPGGRTQTSKLAETVARIDERTADLMRAVESLTVGASEEFAKVWTALGGIAGLDGLSVGLAEISEVMGPLRQMVPPTTALPLAPGVPEALAGIREALGGRRDSNFQRLATDWDLPVRFIGEALPVGRYVEERVA